MKASYNQQTKIIDTLWSDESIIPKGVDIIDFPEEYLQKFYANDYYYFTYENEEVVEHYNNNKVINEQISQLKFNLADTDYQALKFYEGEITPEEFEPIKQQRHAWRQRIKELENQLKGE